MSRTITALFDSRSEAEEARTRLTQSSIDADNVRILDQSSSSSSGGSEGGSGGGFWASVKEAFLPEEDRHAYEEGVRRGGYLLCASVDENRADEAIRLLEESNSIDFDERQEQWRGDGWPGFQGTQTRQGIAGEQFSGGFGDKQETAGFAGQQAASDFTGTEQRSSAVEEERIPIVEEQLKVGKREYQRGGARVRSYIEEVPVHEQVTLREEHVSVERRPVDQPISERNLRDSDLLRERDITMTETAEEAVVGKVAEVREELVVRKTAEQRTEQIDDTVRHTEVEVEEGRSGEDRSAFGSFGSGSTQGSSSTQSSGTTQGGGFGTSGFSGSDSDREAEGTGYDPRIDKSGL